MLKKFFYNEDAQGMTEYILLVVLIAIAAIVAVKLFRGKVKAKFKKAGEDIEKAK